MQIERVSYEVTTYGYQSACGGVCRSRQISLLDKMGCHDGRVPVKGTSAAPSPRPTPPPFFEPDTSCICSTHSLLLSPCTPTTSHLSYHTLSLDPFCNPPDPFASLSSYNPLYIPILRYLNRPYDP